MKAIRLLLVDDQSLFREGLNTLLSLHSCIEIVGEAANGEECLQRVRALKPQVVLMDLRMPVMGGVAATRRIQAEHPMVRVIVLTTFDDDEDVFEALRAGAAGYMLKDAPSDKLIEAIQAAANGESFLQPSVAAKVIAEFTRLSHGVPEQNQSLVEPLSEREVEVLRQLTHGKSNKEIAVALSIAEGTVKNHMTNVLGKLGVMDRTQAALRARELGLI